MLHALKPFHCPNCNSVYCSRDSTRYHGPVKFPLILPCSHSACENCLSLAVKNKADFSCAECKFPIDISEGNPSISKLHPDVHALGILNANRKKDFPSIKVKMLSKENPQSPSHCKKVAMCEICMLVEALWQCEECQQNFCNQCFDQVHKELKSKKKHEVRKIFAELYNTMVQGGCPEHKNKSVEFYCEKDDQLTCSHCMLVGNHIGHEVKTLADKNKSCADDLKNVLEEISGIEKRLRYTEHLLNEVSTGEKIDVSQYIKTVHDNFHRLHCLLQLREAKLIADLETASQIQDEPFANMAMQISSSQKEIASMKRDAESVIENPCLAVSAPYLLKKLESYKSLPCYLLPVEGNNNKKLKIDLLLNDEVEDLIRNYGSVDYVLEPRYRLVPSEELPENYCLDIPESFQQSSLALSDADSQSNVTLDNISEDSLTSPSSKYGIQAAFKCRDFTRLLPEKVLVSHIKNPSCFWVQRCADLRKLNSISDAINKWCKTHEAQRNKPTDVERGDLYLVQFSVDKKWYRGRVRRILEAGETYEQPSVGMKSSVISKEKRTVKKDEVKIDIFYIDYGNSEVVSMSNMQNIQARFLNLAGLAKQCSLVDIASAGEEWSPAAIKSFTKFVSFKPVIMQVYEERSNVLQVDLSQVADNGISNDVPASVRDALVFQEHAVFPAGKNITCRQYKNESRSFLPPERLRANSDISVIVSHVDCPSYFYVQQIPTASYLSSLIFEMNDYYNQEANTLLHGIYAPRMGMICAAQFSLDKQWYRAQVKSLPGGANVEVQYVDFGNSEVINHKFVRKLADKFCKLNIQAIPCKLADVTYNQGRGWSTEAIEWLTNKVSKKQLTLKSLGYVLGENKTEAVLFYSEGEFEICVNALMVNEGLASSSGPESTEVKKRSNIPIPPPVEQTVPLIFERISSHESIDEGLISPPIEPQESKVKRPTLVKSFPETEGKHIEVHISHIETPSLFYVRIAGDIEKKLQGMMSEMQKTYKNMEMSISNCCIGKSYAVFSETTKQWHRGTILSLNDDKAKVQFVDFGTTEEVPVKNIQKLLEQFTVDEEFAICCELSGIIPAGGSSHWSYLACDSFKELTSSHEILHLSFKGDINNADKSLPVSLFLEQIIIGGALEPNQIVFVNIATELTNRGLALPIRNPPKINTKSSDSHEAESTESPIQENMLSPAKSTKDCSSGKEICELPVETPSLTPEKCIKDASVPESPKHEEKIAEILKQKPRFQWKQVIYPMESKFKGFVTNIGEDGSIQLHVQQEKSSVVETIKKALQFKYTKFSSEPPKTLPPIGEACVAKFSLDNLWYRAEILALYDGKVKVNFVDYGNNEIVPLNDIRTDVIMQNFPRQCIECVIFGIHTGQPGQWDQDLLNFLHSQLVESVAEVEVMGPPDQNGKLPCHITSCGISIAELLNNMGFMGAFESMEECRTFQKATELQEGDIFPVCITQISSPDIIYLQRLKIPEPKSDSDMEHNKEHDAFLELISELQDKAETFPVIKEPLPGLACCAKYSYDENWYRCEVTDLTADGGVVVLYVDYGNTETISAENLRNPESDFINFPVQVHFCKVHGMSPVDSEWDPEVKAFLVEKLLKSGQEIFARVVTPGEISEIDLVIKSEDGEMKLVYEELVQRKLITLQQNH